MAGKKNKPTPQNRIAVNKKARFDYLIEETFEAGLVLQGWEVKSLRAGRAQISESYVLLREGEAWLFGAHISPLLSASTHIHTDSSRTRKLLLHRSELRKLIGAVERRGYALVPLSMYWKRGRAKVAIGLGKGKFFNDTATTEKARDWQRDKQRILHRGG
jgi:SsrA-binding protein